MRKSRALERSEAVAELTRRYFHSHGPAQLQDLVWWSGLSIAEARSGIAGAGAVLDHHLIDGKDYWADARAGAPPDAASVAHLLPNFDEYTVAYRDRSSLLNADSAFEPELFAFGSILSNVVTIGGCVRGAWRRTSAGGGVKVEVRVMKPLETLEVAAVEDVGRRMGRFLERPVAMVWRERSDAR